MKNIFFGIGFLYSLWLSYCVGYLHGANMATLVYQTQFRSQMYSGRINMTWLNFTQESFLPDLGFIVKSIRVKNELKKSK